MRKLTQLLIAAFVVVVGTFLGTAAASASGGYTQVLPNGLSTSKSAAKKQVQQLVSNDAGIQARLAMDNGISVNEVAGATVASVSKTKVTIGKNDDNSARVASSGAVVPSSYMYGQTVTAWKVTLKISATKTIVVKWKRDCSNPFIPKGNSRPPLRITKKTKVFTMPFKKSKTTSRTVVCPSGQQITVTVVSTIKGKVRVKSLTKGVRLISQKMTARISIDVTNAIKVTCAAPPTAPPGPTASNDCPQGQTRDSNNTCVAIAVQCKANEVKDSAGNCVVQSNTAEQNCKAIGGTFNGATQLCTIIMINANCSNVTVVNGSGNVVSTSQEGNCNSSPPPSCPAGTTGVYPNCQPVKVDHPPVVNIMGSPAHLYVGGNAYVWIEASDSDGDAVSVKVSASGAGTVAGLVPSAVRWDGTPCPSGKSCYRATAWAGSFAGNMTVTATVTAGGKSGEPDSATFPVKPDDFG